MSAKEHQKPDMDPSCPGEIAMQQAVLSSSNSGRPSAGRDLLARAFLDILAREEGARIKPMLRACNDPTDAIELILDDLSDFASDDKQTSLRPDLAAVAVLTARAIEAEPGLARRLRRDAPVVVFTTHTPDFVHTVETVIATCALPPNRTVFGRSLKEGNIITRTAALVLASDGTGKYDKPDSNNEPVTIGLHRRMPIIGIAPDPRRHLPRTLMQTAEYRLTLPQIDETALALVVEAVTGKQPTRRLSANSLRVLDVADLPLALRSDRSANECVDLLERVVARKVDYLGDGPSLEELDGYGEAKTWGLELAADLIDLRSGRIDWSLVDHKGMLLFGSIGQSSITRGCCFTAPLGWGRRNSRAPWQKPHASRSLRRVWLNGIRPAIFPGPYKPSAKPLAKHGASRPAFCSSTSWTASPIAAAFKAIMSNTGRKL